MNCKICGAELKKSGELCNNCMNKLMREQEIKNDNNKCFTFRRKFLLKYELLKISEQIAIVLFMIILAAKMSYWKFALATGVFFPIVGIIYLIYRKVKINSGVCSLYKTKLVFTEGVLRKKTKVIPYDEIEEISYDMGNMQKLCNVATIVIKRKTRNILEKFTYIESVRDIETVFGKIGEIFKG